MAGAEYNGVEGILRIKDAAGRQDTAAPEILTLHAAVESELDVVLKRLMPFPEKIFSKGPQLSFALKARLLAALWKKDPADADKLNAVLKAFEDLRNSIAHPGHGSTKTLKAKLDEAYRKIDASAGDDPAMFEIAVGICAFMTDDPDAVEVFRKVLAEFNKLGAEREAVVFDTWNRFLQNE